MFSRLFANRTPKAARNTRRCLSSRRLRCEPLEERQMLSVYANSTPLAIPDVGSVTSQISVPDAFIVGDLNVKLTIQHPSDRALHAYLIAPDNTRVELFSDVGGAKGQNFTNTVLDDEATTSITLGSAPFTGTFRPEGNLSVVEGKGAKGIWKLEVTDDTKRSTGKLMSWSIDVTEAGVPAGTNFIDTNPTMLGNAGLPAGSLNFYPSRKIVVSDNGDAMAVWQESKGPGDTGPWCAMAARYDADAMADKWQTPVVIMEGDLSNSSFGLELAGDGRGNYLAVIVQADPTGYHHLSVSRYLDGSGWLPAEPLAGRGATAPQASMARDAQGVTRAVVAWCDQIAGAGDVKISRLDNFAIGSWSGEELAENLPSDPGVQATWIDVAMAQNGDFMLVFAERYPTTLSPPSDAYYRVYRNGAGWEGPEAILEYRSEAAQMPKVAMNSLGEAMVVWRQRTGPDNIGETWARRWNGVGWDTDPEKIVDSAAGTAASFTPGGVALSENGEAIVFWAQQRDGSAFSNAYVRRNDGTQWGEIIKLDTEDLGAVGAGASSAVNSDRMNIAIDDSGNAAAVWTQYDGFYVNIWASQFTKATSTWSTAEKLENAALDAVMPSVDMSAGVAQVIWTQSDGSLNHMYSATLTAPAGASYAPTGLSAARASASPEMTAAIDFAMCDLAGGSTGRKKSTKADHDLLLATYDPLVWL